MMKNLFILFVLISSLSFAQTGINYQGAATDADGAKLVNQNISLKTSVLQGGVDGTTSYSEIHNTTTDQFGLFNVVIGQGVSISGDFETISWGSGDHFLKVELDATGGTNYSLVSTTQMMSVPYALYAKNAGLDSSAVADMLASMNISSNHSGGCNPHYPEGLNGEGVTWNFDDGDYLVPSGKNLYITNASFVGNMKIDDITVRYGITNDVFNDVYENNLSAPIIAGQNQIVSFIGNTSNSIFNGILVDATSLQAVTIDLQTEAYTVPNNKRLFVISPFLSHEPDVLFIDDLVINTGALNLNQLMGFNNPLVLNSGQEIRSELAFGTEGSINGYLVDEDYFADCGGSGGSSSSTPSSLDSAMVADMIAANTSSGSGGDWELLYDELNTNLDLPWGTVNRYGIAQSDGFLYIVGQNLELFIGNDHDTITNIWQEEPIYQQINLNSGIEPYLIPLKKDMNWHIQFHSTAGSIRKGYFIPNAGGSSSLANSGMSGTSKSFKYPDGMHGTPITIAVGTDNNYTVPEGKNLYANYFRTGNGGSLYIDGIRVASDYNNVMNNQGSELLYVGEGQTITCDNELDDNLNSTLNGLLVDKSVDIVSFGIGDLNSYTVPNGKNLYVNYFRPSSGGSLYINGVKVSTSYNTFNNQGSELLYVGEGQTITCDNELDINLNSTLNGYLADLDYFESSSSSSASNSGDGGNTMDLSVSTFGDTLTIGNQSVIIPGISYENVTPEFGSVTDIDGNTYQTININGTEWMTEDLRVSKFSNGDPIDLISSNNNWNNSICNSPNYIEYQGVHYYNYLTIVDSRNVCPTGWSVPTASDYENILNLFNNGEPPNNDAGTNYGNRWDHAAPALKSNSSNGNQIPLNDWYSDFSITVNNNSYLSFLNQGMISCSNNYNGPWDSVLISWTSTPGGPNAGNWAIEIRNNVNYVGFTDVENLYYNSHPTRCVKD